MDSASEQYVHRMVEWMRENEKTVILIAHRLSSVLRADKIVVLSQGTVVEEGHHDQLISNRKQYFELWKQQFPMMQEIA